MYVWVSKGRLDLEGVLTRCGVQQIADGVLDLAGDKWDRGRFLCHVVSPPVPYDVNSPR
jgi:hypothetical protein